MSYPSFLADAAAVRDHGDWLVELYLTNPQGGETVLRYSRRGTVTGLTAVTVGSDTIPANTRFEKRLAKAPTVTQTLWQPNQIFGGSFPVPGSMQLTNQDGLLDRYRPVEGYVWRGGRCKVFRCDIRDIQGTIGKTFDGFLDRPRFSLGAPVEIPLRNRESLFEVKTSERVYRGGSYMLELSGAGVANYGAPAAVNTRTSMTAEAWIWIDAMPTATQQIWGWAGGTNVPWRWTLTSGGLIAMRATIGGAGAGPTMTAALAAFKPYHLSVVIAGQDVIFRLWDDDAQTLTTETVAAAFSSATRDSQAGAPFYAVRTGGDATLRMWVDEMRVWDVARTAAEIAADRFRPIPAGSVPASLVHYATMDDGTGATVTDRSATAANGTLTGASTWLWSMEGTAELAGTPKADVWGRRFGCSPILVDPVRSRYQIAGGGSLQGFATFAGGAPHTMLTNAASARAFLTSTPGGIGAGNCLPYLARGWFALGAAASFPVAATVEGYNGGPLGYVSTPPTVIRDLVTRRGPLLADPSGLDTASFTALAAAPMGAAPIGVFLPEPEALRATIDRAGGAAAAWWGYERASTLFKVAKFTGPAGTADFAFDQTDIVRIDEFPPQEIVYQVIVRYQQSSVVLNEGQVDATVKGTAGWQRWTKEWLETPPQTDDAIRAQYPGAESVSLTFDTPLYEEADAIALARELLELLKGGQHEGFSITMRAPGFELSVGKTATFQLVLQNGVTRLGLDGTRRFVIIGIEDNRMEGTVTPAVWR